MSLNSEITITTVEISFWMIALVIGAVVLAAVVLRKRLGRSDNA